MKYCDIGVNLTNNRFLDDLQQVIDEARGAGVEQIIITGTSEQESAKAKVLAEQLPSGLYYTAGVHPHDADYVSEDWISHLQTLLNSPKAVAVGECGLDFNRNFSSKEGQIKAFEAQLALAKQTQKPVFLHERDAFTEQLAMLKNVGISEGVAHCFTGTTAQMWSYIELGLYIGVTGWVCDPKRGTDLQSAVAELPMNRLLLETDAPFLLPKTLPKSIRRNEPKYIQYVAETVAEIKGISVEEVAAVSYQNANDLFMLS